MLLCLYLTFRPILQYTYNVYDSYSMMILDRTSNHTPCSKYRSVKRNLKLTLTPYNWWQYYN